MTTLHMETDSVRLFAQQIRQTTAQTEELANYTMHSMSNMDWIGPSREEFGIELQRLITNLLAQADHGRILANRVERETQEWEQVSATFLKSNYSVITAAGGGVSIMNFWYLAPTYTLFTIFNNLNAPDWVRDQIGNLFNPTTAAPPITENVAPEPAPPPSEEINLENNDDSYYNITPQDQGNLYGSAACGPTSVSMIMDYYHQKDAHNLNATPQEIISGLDKGDGTLGSGISLSRLDDDIQEYGYQVNWQTSASLDDLKKTLKEGPAIINGMVDLKGQDIDIPGSQVNHSMVVKGISPEKVIINDPWSGTEKEIPINDFQTMWERSKSVLYVIRP